MSSTDAQTGDAFVLDHDFESFDVASLFNLLLLEILTLGVTGLGKPPLVTVLLIDWLSLGLLGLNLSDFLCDLKVSPLSKSLEH